MAPLGSSDLTFTPDDEAVRVLRKSWQWLLGDDWSPLLFSVLGDVFVRKGAHVCWLNTGTGEITEVAASENEFRQLLAGDSANEWLLPNLVAELYALGKRPGAGECFTYAIYPIFAEGKYEAWNFAPVPAQDHFGASAEIHQQMSAVPDGATVEIRVVD